MDKWRCQLLNERHEKARKAVVVTDLFLGDSGKGTVVDFLTRELSAGLVVRHNGGAQAAHNVVTPEWRHSVFAQFGSGSFVKGVKTHLSRFMLVEPISFMKEASSLMQIGIGDILDRTTIDEGALLTSRLHIAANRLRELSRGEKRQGSCGKGIGETVADSVSHPESVIRMSDLADPETLRAKLTIVLALQMDKVRPLLSDLPKNNTVEKEVKILFQKNVIDVLVGMYREFSRRVNIISRQKSIALLQENPVIIFEGAQGALLDMRFGFYPHITWSNTTRENAHVLLAEADFEGKTIDLGVIRSYGTRHGAGPFVTEDSALHIPEVHNTNSEWQGPFRVGWLDSVLLRYALSFSPCDCLAMTHLDSMESVPEWKACTQYRNFESYEDCVKFVETANGPRMSLSATAGGPSKNNRERLTECLRKCEPVYSNFPLSGRTEQFISFVERELGLPIVLRSSGATAREKYFSGFPKIS